MLQNIFSIVNTSCRR